MSFAVQTPADVEAKSGKARWAVAVDPVGERFLVVDENRQFSWVPIDECRFIKMVDPEGPTPVVAVAPKGSGLIRGDAGQMPRGSN